MRHDLLLDCRGREASELADRLQKRIFLPSKRSLSNLALPISFILPVLILYLLYPSSFEIVFGEGRAPYLIFLWLICLELALFWRRLTSARQRKFTAVGMITLVLFLVFPTLYVLGLSYTGLHQAIVELGKYLGVPESAPVNITWIESRWPMAFELALFSTCFSVSAWILYRREGLTRLGVAFFFLWAVTVFGMVDTFFPAGKMWILQVFVPFTVNASATVLREMGYSVATKEFSNPVYGFGTALTVFNGRSLFNAVVFWPSAGVHSMIIYALTILLFISNMSISIIRKTVIFIVGAAGTFIANVLRIVTIVKIGLDNGTVVAQHFHDYYGEFFFISWMVIYLSIIVLAPRLVRGLAKRTRAAQVDKPEAETSLRKNEPSEPMRGSTSAQADATEPTRVRMQYTCTIYQPQNENRLEEPSGWTISSFCFVAGEGVIL